MGRIDQLYNKQAKGELMQYGLSAARHHEVEQELNRVEAYLVELRQETHATTTPGTRYTYLWLQVDSTVAYVRSLREALQRENIGQN
jgi:hypothetical protein